MGRQIYYGKPSSYPYRFIAVKKGVPKTREKFNTFWSGSFRTKRAAREGAASYNKYGDFKIKLIDRRKGKE